MPSTQRLPGTEQETQRLFREAALLQNQLDAVRNELLRIHNSRLWRLASVYWATRRAVRRLLGREAPEAESLADPTCSPASPSNVLDRLAEPPAPPDSGDAVPSSPADLRPVPSSASERVAARFAAFRDPGNRRFFDALARHLASIENDPCLSMYFEFAITANQRGEKVAELLAQRLSLAGKKYLDIGCAYAGFLVAFARHGAEVVGIDIDGQLLALAEENLQDSGTRRRLYRRDATRAADLADFRGAFDIVTANDVIEHVDEPALLLRNIADVLRPGGIAYFEIPNRHAAAFVREDGHYKLFGITLLGHAEAKRYYSLHAPGVAYGVGHYLELPEYERLFAGAGLRFELLDEDGENTLQQAEAEAFRLRSSFEERLLTVPEPLRGTVRHEVERYLEEFDKAPRSSPEDRGRFLRRYGTGFWRVLGTKP